LYQIVIGIIIDILTFIPSTLLVTFFRRIRQHRSCHQIAPLIQTLWKLTQDETSDTSTTTSETKKKKKKPRLFPWWCLFIAYGFSYLVIGTCIVLIVARGVEFGELKIHQWLTSMFIGFFSSVLFSQPLKVCFFENLLMNYLILLI
jgi:hypothetical protein